MWRLSTPLLPAPARLAAVALFALNPTTVHFAGIVVSEPLFLFLAVVTFVSLQRALATQRLSEALLLGGIMGWAALVRPQGGVLIVAVAAGLGLARQWRMACAASGVGFLIAGAMFVRNYLAARTATGYLAHWEASLPALLRDPGALLQNAAAVTRTLLAENLMGVPAFPEGSIYAGLVTLGATAAALLIGVGWAGPERTRLTRPVPLAIALYSLLYYGVHLFWSAVDVHYLYPILPFLLVFLVAGAEHLRQEMSGPVAVTLSVFVLVMGRYLYCDAYGIPSATNPPLRIAAQTYRWMRERLPPERFLFTPAAPTVRLYSGHYAYFASPPSDADELRFALLAKGTTHVLAQPVNLQSFRSYGGTSADANSRWERLQRWVVGWPEAFTPVYANAGEGTALYAVKQSAAFQEAFAHYKASFREFEAARFPEAARRLDEALRLYPDFPGALNASGAVSLVMNKDIDVAVTRLRKALRLRPAFPLAALNLARAELRQGRKAQARQAFQRAKDLIHETGEALYLLPVIGREAAVLP
jgi:hypothetical protein